MHTVSLHTIFGWGEPNVHFILMHIIIKTTKSKHKSNNIPAKLAVSNLDYPDVFDYELGLRLSGLDLRMALI